MPPHRIGIVGCGRRGRAFAAAIASLDAAALALCVDDDPAAARACAAAYGGAVAPSWTDEVLDALIMASPRLDSAVLAAAVRDGLRVVIDPPLARGIVDARRAVRAVQSVPGGVGMGFDWRFEPLVRLLRVLTPRPLFAHVSMAVDPGPPQAPESVRETMWTTPHHALDLLVHLFDGPPAEVVADVGPLPASRNESATSSVPPRADALVADLYFDRERHAALTVGGGGADPELGPVVLDLTDGATRVRVGSNWSVAEILPLDGRSPDLPPLPGVRLEREGRALMARVEPDGQALCALMQAFLAPEPADDRLAGAADGARAVAITRAVLAAAASGRTQTLSAA